MSGSHGHPVSFHINTPRWVWKNWLIFYVIFPLSFLFHLVGVIMCLCGRLTLDCKWQSQSCLQLPMKAYRIACC